MSTYTREFLENKAIESMNASEVSPEVQSLFRQKMWDKEYTNMLSEKGIYFILTFLSEKFYSTQLSTLKEVSNIQKLKEKLNDQGFIFYLGSVNVDNIYKNNDNKLYILEPEEKFKEKVALYGGINIFLEGLLDE